MLEKYAREMVEKHQLAFPLLLDPGNKVAGQFGLVFAFPEYLREIYRKFGADLLRFNGDDSWTLPLAARYIVAPDGVIRHDEVGTDYTTRPEPAAIVSILQDLQAG
jgi:peroxiredoxin